LTGEDIGAARNHTRLIQAARARYVALLHDDDRWHPQFLERRVSFLDDHPSCGFVFSPHVQIDATGKESGRLPAVLRPGVYSSAQFLPVILARNVVGIPTVLVRRTAYEAVGNSFNETVLFFDWEMWIRLTHRYPVGYLAAWDAEYRLHELGETQKRRLAFGAHQLRVLDAIERSLGPQLPAGAVKRGRTTAHLVAALECAERGERARSLDHVGAAITARPLSLLEPGVLGRATVVLACAVGGRWAQRALTRERVARWQRGGPRRYSGRSLTEP
jgi:hypothetical protein